MRQGPRIYNLFPSLVGPLDAWKSHLSRIAAMGFDWIFVNPFHEPGFSGSLYAVRDYYKLHPAFRGSAAADDATLLADFVRAADRHGLSVMMDLVINHTSKDSVLVDAKPGWFLRNPDGSLHSPRAIDPNDPSLFTEWGDLAEIDYSDRPERGEMIAYWQALVGHYLDLGITGFRGDAAYKIPAVVWREVIGHAKACNGNAVFFAETLGCRPDEVTALREAGFDYLFNSSKWWDFHAPWLLDQYEAFRAIAPSISFPENHDTERLAADLAQGGVTDPGLVEAIYRQRYLFAAVFSTSVMMPMGYEFGFRRRFDVVRTTPDDWEEPVFDISGFVAAVNRMKAANAVLNQEGPQWREARGDSALIVLRRSDGGDALTLSVINTDPSRDHAVPADQVLSGQERGLREITPGHHDTDAGTGLLHLRPGEIRIFTNQTAMVDAAGLAPPMHQQTACQEPSA
jgi:starch synthase (maltosyl-transferring)